METDSSIDWFYDYILQFLSSPAWKNPILAFIDDHCLIFDEEEENKLAYTDIFERFKRTIESMLENLCGEIGISQDAFLKTCERGLQNPQHRKYFYQILACDNFLSFKKLMIRRNKELEVEVLKRLKKEGHAQDYEIEIARIKKEQADLALAISMSMNEQREFKDTEKEAIREVRRTQDDGTFIESTNPQTEQVSVDAKRQQLQELDRRAQEIKKMNCQSSRETMEERQERLRKQRDLLLQQKRKEREIEMTEFQQLGGNNQDNQTPTVNEAELNRRKNIVNRLRNL